MIQLEIVKIGDSHGVCLPNEVLHRLHVGDGDALLLTETPEGGYRLSPSHPDLARELEIAEAGLRQYRNTLIELAK